MLAYSGSLNWTGSGQWCAGQKRSEVGTPKFSATRMRYALYEDRSCSWCLCFSITPPIPTHCFCCLRDSWILSFPANGVHKPTWSLCSGSSTRVLANSQAAQQSRPKTGGEDRWLLPAALSSCPRSPHSPLTLDSLSSSIQASMC